jgi:hypothetical protein
MRLRLLLALALCVVGALMIVGTAAADPPTKDEFSVVGDQFECGETILTVRTGTVREWTHVHRLKNGLFRIISTTVPRGVTATVEGVPLEQATVYRIVGIGHANYTTPNPDAEGGEVGFFRIKLNIVGPGGLFGTLDYRVQGKRDGQEIERVRGTCQFVEP